MNKQLNKKINKKQKIRKMELDQILSEYYLKNYGVLGMGRSYPISDYMVYGEYIFSFYRGYEVLFSKVTEKKILNFKYSRDIIKHSKREKAEYLKKMFASYEFNLPLHTEVLKEISLKVEGYEFLYMYIENDRSFDFENRITKGIGRFLIENKIYFLFNVKTKVLNEKGEFYVHEYLFCIDTINLNNTKLKLKKILKDYLVDSTLSINYLKNSKQLIINLKDNIKFFDRSKFYSKININKISLINIQHLYMNFVFFDYKEELSDFFKLGIHLKAIQGYNYYNNNLSSYIMDDYYNHYGNKYKKENLYIKKKELYFSLSNFDGLRLLPNFKNIEKDYVFIYLR